MSAASLAAEITPGRVGAALALYGLLWLLFRGARKNIEPDEVRTALLVAVGWSGTVFVLNYMLHLAGLMSFLPWVNNALHSFVWIGFCLTWLYMGVRETTPLGVQCVLFFVASLVVKYGEQLLFGTWEHGHFFHVFRGNAAYVLGWSLLDGLYPVISLFGLRVASRIAPGLIAY